MSSVALVKSHGLCHCDRLRVALTYLLSIVTVMIVNPPLHSLGIPARVLAYFCSRIAIKADRVRQETEWNNEIQGPAAQKAKVDLLDARLPLPLTPSWEVLPESSFLYSYGLPPLVPNWMNERTGIRTEGPDGERQIKVRLRQSTTPYHLECERFRPDSERTIENH